MQPARNTNTENSESPIVNRTPLLIRLYQSGDLVQTVTLWWETRQIAFPYIKEVHTFEDYTSYFTNVVAVNNEVWVAEWDNGMAGFMAMQPGHIEHLYVATGYQRQGVGTALLNKAKERSPQGLSLYTFQKNIPARTLYEKHGFKAVRFGISPDEGEPDVYYEWKK